MKLRELVVEPVEERESRGRTLRHPDRHRAVQPHDRRLLHTLEHLVERRDLRPVRLLGLHGFRVQCGDGGLYRVRACAALGERAFGERDALGNLRTIPARTVLVFEEHQLASGIDARVTACVVQQHQREQRTRFRDVRHQANEQPPQPDRLARQFVLHARFAR